MTDYEVHEPGFDGTTTGGWDAPRERDFDTGDLGDVAEHFVLSSSGFPPEEYADLRLPVVEPDGDLNENALRTARRGGRSVGRIEDVDDDTVDAVEDLVDDLLEEHFEAGGAGRPAELDDGDPAKPAADDDPGETRGDDVPGDEPRTDRDQPDEQSAQRHRDAREEENPDAHRDDPPFNS